MEKADEGREAGEETSPCAALVDPAAYGKSKYLDKERT